MVVTPHVVVDGVARRREVAEFVDVAVVFAPFAASWREARSWSFLFVDAISIEDLRSRLLSRSVLVLAKELRTLRVCKLIRGCCKVGGLL